MTTYYIVVGSMLVTMLATALLGFRREVILNGLVVLEGDDFVWDKWNKPKFDFFPLSTRDRLLIRFHFGWLCREFEHTGESLSAFTDKDLKK